jgi:creatinine amidohydrolase
MIPHVPMVIGQAQFPTRPENVLSSWYVQHQETQPPNCFLARKVFFFQKSHPTMKLAELSSPAIDLLSRDIPVVVPIAAIEQHGQHLPVWTDSLLLGEITDRVERNLKEKILVTPLMWLGNSDHHLDFCGTLSASGRTYLDILNDLVENLIFHGFKRIVLLNGHGGNDVPAKQAIFEVRQRHRARKDLLLLMTTYWGLGTEPWKDDPTIEQRDMGHACEWETSMVLAIRPDLVVDHKNVPVVEPGNAFRTGYRAWTTKDRSSIGHIGWPHLASKEKGELLLNAFAVDVERWLARVVAWNGSSWDG